MQAINYSEWWIGTTRAAWWTHIDEKWAQIETGIICFCCCCCFSLAKFRVVKPIYACVTHDANDWLGDYPICSAHCSPTKKKSIAFVLELLDGRCWFFFRLLFSVQYVAESLTNSQQWPLSANSAVFQYYIVIFRGISGTKMNGVDNVDRCCQKAHHSANWSCATRRAEQHCVGSTKYGNDATRLNLVLYYESTFSAHMRWIGWATCARVLAHVIGSIIVCVVCVGHFGLDLMDIIVMVDVSTVYSDRFQLSEDLNIPIWVYFGKCYWYALCSKAWGI